MSLYVSEFFTKPFQLLLFIYIIQLTAVCYIFIHTKYK